MQAVTGLSALSGIVSSGIPTYDGITLVQEVGVDGGAGSSASISWNQATVPGNLLIATMSNYFGGTPTTPSGWTSAISASASEVIHMWYIANADSRSGSEEFSIASNFDGIGRLTLAEYGGIAKSSPLDQTASNTGFQSTATSGTTSTTTAANELWIAALAYSSSNSYSDVTNGFSTLNHGTFAGGSDQAGFFAKIVSTTGTASVSVTISGATTANCGGVIATFKSA